MMATDLFFTPPAPRSSAAGIYSEKTSPSDSAASAMSKTGREPHKAGGESFLTTLNKVSQKPNPTAKLNNSTRAKCANNEAPVQEDDMDDTSDSTAVEKDEKSAPALPQDTSEAAAPDQVPFIRDFMALIQALEEMGFYHSDGGSDRQNPVDADPADSKDFAALKTLLARLQQNEVVSATELKAAFERLQQFIAKALQGNFPAPVDGNSGNSPAMDQVSDSTRIFQWLNELAAGPHQEGNENEMRAGETVPDAKPAASTLADIGGMLERAVDTMDATAGGHKGSGSLQSAENAGVTPPAESRSAMDPAKGTTENIPLQVQTSETPKEAAVVEKSDADSARSKEEMAILRETKTVSRVDSAQPSPAGQDRMPPNNAAPILDQQPLKQSALSDFKIASGSFSNGSSQAAAGEEPVSKVFQDGQSLKVEDVKVASGMSEELGGKVIKTEAGTNDPGQSSSQHPYMEKTIETALPKEAETALPKEGESDRNGLKTQALDQIVQKAAIHLKDGQHEARIDLKPEFLGHIRMTVISENHQVTVKILAEHGFVKDMIQNHAHQLKADLQQHGLDVDKLEVSVSRDSDESGNPKERLAGMRTRQGAADNGKQRNPGQGSLKDHRQPRRNPGVTNKVDYFA